MNESHKLTINDLERLVPNPYIQREKHTEIYNHLKQDEVTILYGPRQVGKSSEIFNSLAELWQEWGEYDVFYFNLDQNGISLGEADSFLANVLSQHSHKEHPAFIVIDEAQRHDQIGLFVKYLYDQKQDVKFVITGSASLDIYSKVKESLMGRKQEFNLLPLTLGEILKHKGVNLEALEIDVAPSFFASVLNDYMLFGGYPGVVILPSEQAKKQKLKELAEAYLYKDLVAQYSLKDNQINRIVLLYLAENIGNMLSLENMCQVTGINRREAEKYLEILEKTFMLLTISPYYKDKSKEIIHQSKSYFYDLGIRNALLGRLDMSQILVSTGAIFENVVALNFVNKIGKNNVHFWRTKNQTEIDFILEPVYNELSAYEVKYTANRGVKSLVGFKEVYGEYLKESEVINRDNFWRFL